MNKTKKNKYVSPQIEVIHMENEGVIAASAGSDFPNVPMNPGAGTYSGRNVNSASSSDLEDLINDILTVEN